jgi:hypothetical protein
VTAPEAEGLLLGAVPHGRLPATAPEAEGAQVAVIYSSKSCEWSTPPDLFRRLNARQEALLGARLLEADSRARQTFDRVDQLRQDGAPAEEVHQAELEYQRAAVELLALRVEIDIERRRWQDSWHARLLREVRRRTGW